MSAHLTFASSVFARPFASITQTRAAAIGGAGPRTPGMATSRTDYPRSPGATAVDSAVQREIILQSLRKVTGARAVKGAA